MTPTIASEATRDRLAKFESQVLAHPMLGSVYDAVLSLIQSAAVPIVEIVGPTGVGKSTLIKKLRTELLKQFSEAMTNNPGLIPVIMVEAPSPDSGKFHWGDFYRRLLKASFEPMIGHKSLNSIDGESPVGLRKTGTITELRWAVEQCIKQRGTKVVIIDEAQHLTKVAGARPLQDQMDTVKSLSSLSGVQFVMVGTYELLTLLNQNGQLARRTRCIHFRRYDFEKPGDRQTLVNLLAMFESRLPVTAAGVLTSNLEYIYEHSLGCIGILKDWLKDASNQAVVARRDLLALRDLEATALTNDSLLQILQEILEGERSIDASTKRGGDLRAKLGLKSVQNSAAPPGDAKMPSVRRTVGERKPNRDLVGV